MPDAMEERDELAEALEDRGWDVIDTFGGLEESPSLVVAIEDVEIENETFAMAELTVTVTKPGLSVDRVEITDEDLDLSDAQRDLLDDVSTEKLAGPELTLWEYEPGTVDDNIDDYFEEIQGIYEDI